MTTVTPIKDGIRVVATYRQTEALVSTIFFFAFVAFSRCKYAKLIPRINFFMHICPVIIVYLRILRRKLLMKKKKSYMIQWKSQNAD